MIEVIPAMSYCCVVSSHSKGPASRANPYVLATELTGCVAAIV